MFWFGFIAPGSRIFYTDKVESIHAFTRLNKKPVIKFGKDPLRRSWEEMISRVHIQLIEWDKKYNPEPVFGSWGSTVIAIKTQIAHKTYAWRNSHTYEMYRWSVKRFPGSLVLGLTTKYILVWL